MLGDLGDFRVPFFRVVQLLCDPSLLCRIAQQTVVSWGREGASRLVESYYFLREMNSS